MGQDVFRTRALRSNDFLLMGIVIILLVGCGMHDQGEVASTGDTGVVTFSVQWMPSDESEDSDKAQSLAAQPQGAVNCTTYGIGQIQLEVWRFLEGTSTGVGAIRDCSAHAATLSGVPADVPVYVSLTSGDWYGMSSSFTLSSGETHDLGVIEVRDTVPSRWHTAVTVDNGSANLGSIEPVSVAMDGSGNAIVVWNQENFEIYASRFTPSAGWGSERFIGGGGSSLNVYAPRIAMNTSGDAMVAWMDCSRDLVHATDVYSVYVNQYSPDSDWGLQGPIGTETTIWSESDIPRVAMNASGSAIVVWSMNDGDGWDIYAKAYSPVPGIWWQQEIVDTIDGGYHAHYPQVAMDNSGNAIAVWDFGNGRIYVSRYVWSTGIWSSETEIGWRYSGSSSKPRIAMDDSGNAIVVWSTRKYVSDTVHSVYANRYTASTDMWDGETLLENSGGDVGDPEVAMDGDGNAFVVWTQDDPLSHVNAIRYTASTASWGNATLIESHMDNSISPRIAMDDSGNATAVWAQWEWIGDSIHLNIYANQYSASTGSWGTETRIDDNNLTSQHPHLAMSGFGKAVVAWDQFDGAWNRPYANHYD